MDAARQLEQAYKEQRTAVYHLALAYMKNPAAAEDVMQEVFLSCYDLLRRGESIRNLRGWLLTATRNRCLNALRDGRPEELTDDFTALIAPVSDPADRLALRQALEGLTPEERLAFTLHVIDGYKYREIAAGLDLPMGTVQTRCRTAKRKLRAALA